MRRRELNLADLSMLVLAGDIVRERLGHNATLYIRSGVAEVFVGHRQFASVIESTGVDPQFEDTRSGEFRWKATVEFAGTMFYSYFSSETLHEIGYSLPEGTVIPEQVPLKTA